MRGTIQPLPEPARNIAVPAQNIAEYGFSGSIIGQDDITVFRSWISEYQDSPNTQRAYFREGERFLLWVQSVREKDLRSLDRADIEAYRQFMAKPPASWCGTRNGKRKTGDRRPFEQAVSANGQRQSLIILGSFFRYLVDGGYLNANPIALVRRKGTAYQGNPNRTVHQEHHAEFMAYLKQASSAGGRPARRAYFVIRWLYHTGARRAELATGKLKDIQASRLQPGSYQWTVYGKGGTVSWLPLREGAIQCLEEYFGKPVSDILATLNPETFLLPRLRGDASIPLGADQVYDIVRNAWADFVQTRPDIKAVLPELSPHFLRHAITKHLLDAGTDLRHVKRFMRHKSVNTTLKYDSNEDRLFVAAIR